jgi:hypothetical protein
LGIVFEFSFLPAYLITKTHVTPSARLFHLSIILCILDGVKVLFEFLSSSCKSLAILESVLLVKFWARSFARAMAFVYGQQDFLGAVVVLFFSGLLHFSAN